MQRLGKNKDGYKGETIDIASVVREDLSVAQRFGWQIERLPVATDLELLAFTRPAASNSESRATPRIYISTGIHGDEPAGPLAIRQLLQESQWPLGTSFWLCPCLNPTGFPLNRRENAKGVDLNRDYRHLHAPEVRAHVAWLERQPGFDLTICVHEDWESHGFYLYELNPDRLPSPAERVIEAVSKVCPIDQA